MPCNLIDKEIKNLKVYTDTEIISKYLCNSFEIE